MGVGNSFYEAGFITRTFIYLVLGRVLADKEVQEKITFDAKGLKWVIVRPGGLVDTETEIWREVQIGTA